MSRDEKKFQKELQNALSVSTKGPLDTSLVIGNRHAHLEENDDVIKGHAHSGGSANEDTVETSYEPGEGRGNALITIIDSGKGLELETVWWLIN